MHGTFSQIIFRSTSENSEEMHQDYFLFGIFSSLRAIISEIKYLNFEKLVIQRISLMMFKCSIGVLPSPVSAVFQYNSIIHTHNNRRSNFIHTPIGRSEATYRTFSYHMVHTFEIIFLEMFPQIFHRPVLKI